MVVNHRERWIYVAPPKTGSTSMVALLTDPVVGGQILGEQHGMSLPSECSRYTIFGTVRNPFSRAVSLWWHRLTELANQVGQRRVQEELIARYSLTHFLDWIEGPNATPFYAWPICGWLDQLVRLDHAVRLENLWDDLSAIGIRLDPSHLPCLNATPHKAIEVYYTAELEGRVKDWAKDDFDRFAYPRQLWVPGGQNVAISASNSSIVQA
jgi:hypothetical protein